MRNIKLTIEYDGTNYQGWQIQQRDAKDPGAERTIQGLIEKALHKILQEEIRVQGAGRTDAGVSALAQCANFKTRSQMPLQAIKRALNSILPKDMVITRAEEVGLGFNARFDAKSKIYSYSIFNRDYPCAINRHFFHYVPYKLDASLMSREAKALKGRHDFKSFQATDKSERGSVRQIKNISVKKHGHIITIEIEANGFVYFMVRNIVGTLIDIGRGRFSAGSMKKILHAKDRTKAGPTAPARGLCLMQVRY